MSWADFGVESALERDVLERGLPLVPIGSDGSSRVTVDLVANKADIAMTIAETIGPTPSGCVDLLRIRPLLVGAAWKVLDLLLETSLEEANIQPDRQRRWSIKRKVSHARAADGRPSQFGTHIWSALMNTYVETAELRHSLVHRRAHTDAANALVAFDDQGNQLRPLSPTEQEAFVRSVLRASEIALAPALDARVEADLIRQLGMLVAVHGVQLPNVTLLDSLPEITVIIDSHPTETSRYALDIPALKARQPFKGATHADLVVHFRDRPGQQAVAHSSGSGSRELPARW